MYKSHEVRDIQTNRTARWDVPDAIGLQLVPVPGTLAAYPITIVLDDIEGAPVVVHNASWATQETSFTSVKVMDGVPGSQWLLRTMATPADAGRLQLPTARDGALVTRGAPPIVLFDLDSAKDPSVFVDNVVNAGWGNIVIAPAGVDGRALPVIITDDPEATFSGYAWDVGGFSRVIFVVESFVAATATRPNTILIPKVDLCGHAGPSSSGSGFADVVPALRTVQAGTNGNLGDAGVRAPGATVAGKGTMDCAWVELGAPRNRLTANTAEDTAIMPGAKFRLVTNAAIDNTVNFTDGSYRLRIYALAW